MAGDNKSFEECFRKVMDAPYPVLEGPEVAELLSRGGVQHVELRARGNGLLHGKAVAYTDVRIYTRLTPP